MITNNDYFGLWLSILLVWMIIISMNVITLQRENDQLKQNIDKLMVYHSKIKKPTPPNPKYTVVKPDGTVVYKPLKL